MEFLTKNLVGFVDIFIGLIWGGGLAILTPIMGSKFCLSTFLFTLGNIGASDLLLTGFLCPRLSWSEIFIVKKNHFVLTVLLLVSFTY